MSGKGGDRGLWFPTHAGDLSKTEIYSFLGKFHKKKDTNTSTMTTRSAKKSALDDIEAQAREQAGQAEQKEQVCLCVRGCTQRNIRDHARRELRPGFQAPYLAQQPWYYWCQQNSLIPWRRFSR